MTNARNLSGNGDLNLDTRLDGHGGLKSEDGSAICSRRCDLGAAETDLTHDLLDNLGGGLEVDETLVDAHLEVVPGLGSLSARLQVHGRVSIWLLAH